MTRPEASPGAALRAEREALGVTVREVAETLNLSMTTIDAIESDDFERLPGPVFARGYVRAYARLLELDPRPLLEHYPKAQEAAAAVDGAPEPEIREWIRNRPAVVLGAAGGALLLVLLVIVAALWPEGDVDEAAVPEVAAVEADRAAEFPATAVVQPPAAAALPAARSEPAIDAPVEDAAAAQMAERAPADEVAVPATLTPTVPGPIEVAPESATLRRITATGEDRLSFGFSDDCWVEVKNAGGTRLYSDLNRAGSELELVGEGPFRILLGYAPGARLTFNGEPVPLAPHTRDNVATLVLGQ